MVNFVMSTDFKKDKIDEDILFEIKETIIQHFSDIEGVYVKKFDTQDITKNKGIFKYGDFQVSYGSFEIENDYTTKLYQEGFYKRIICDILDNYKKYIEYIETAYAGVWFQDEGLAPYLYCSSFTTFYDKFICKRWSIILNQTQKEILLEYLTKNGWLNKEGEIYLESINNSYPGMQIYNFIKKNFANQKEN